jgi:hypothetical protein
MRHVAAPQRLVLARINVADREAGCVLNYEMAALSQLNPPRPWEPACAHPGSPSLLLLRPRRRERRKLHLRRSRQWERLVAKFT